MEEKNFSVLYLEKAPMDVDMPKFYNDEGHRNGFKGVYTQEGYYLSNEVNSGRHWHKWFLEIRKDGAISYTRKVSVFQEDHAMIVNMDVEALNEAGETIATKKLSSTYIDSNSKDFQKEEKEFTDSFVEKFNEKISNVETFLQWQGWAQAKGL